MVTLQVRLNLILIIAVWGLLASVFSARGATPQEPLTAQFDVLSTPTLARGGQVIWAGMSGVTPDAAALTFILTPPAGAPTGAPERVTTMPLTMTRGEVAERIYAFDTPASGDWRVTALARLSAGGKTWTQTAALKLAIKPQAAPLKTSATPAPTITPLTIDGPLVAGAITTPGEIKWFSFVPSMNYLTFECLPGTLTNFEMSVQINTDSWNPTYPTPIRYTGQGYSASSTSWWSTQPKTWHVGIRANAPQTTGTFFIHITSGPFLSFKINDGSKATSNRTVTLNLSSYYNYYSNPVMYIASESPDFKGASWQNHYSNPNFTLSPGNGLKTVYVKTRDSKLHESAEISHTITLHELTLLTIDGAAVNDRVSVSSEVAYYSFTVTQHDRYRIYVQTTPGDPATYPRLFNGPDPWYAPFVPSVSGNLYDLAPGNYTLTVTSAAASRFSVRVARDHLTNQITPNGPAVTGTVTASDQLPWYYFKVTQMARFTITLKPISGGPAFTRLFGPDNENLLIPTNPTVLAPGEYVVKVFPITTPCTYTLQVVYDSIATLAINSGATTTTSRVVTLNNNCSGAPQSYMASIYADFRDGAWLPYSANPTFKLNAGNVEKTVYFKVYYAAGGESAVMTDSIVLREVTSLPLGAAALAGNINPVGDADWYQFTVTAAGSHTIETCCGTLEDTVLELYDAAWKPLARDDDSGENYAAKLTVTLPPATYYVKVTPRFVTETGTYTITAVKK